LFCLYHVLQAPLASLDTVAHVMCRLTRTRAAATDLLFSSAANPLQRAVYRQQLYDRALELQAEHSTLLYGSRIMLQVVSLTLNFVVRIMHMLLSKHVQ
jgi:hypothetical protein